MGKDLLINSGKGEGFIFRCRADLAKKLWVGVASIFRWRKKSVIKVYGDWLIIFEAEEVKCVKGFKEGSISLTKADNFSPESSVDISGMKKLLSGRYEDLEGNKFDLVKRGDKYYKK